MNFKEYLESVGLSSEQVEAVLKGMPENKFYLASEENLDERYAKLKTQKEQAISDLKTANTLIDELKVKSSNAEDLQKQIEQYKQNVLDLENQRANDRKNSYIELGLTRANVKNDKALTALLDLEKIVEQDGKFTGLDEQIQALRESDSYLFNLEPKPNPTPKISAGGNPEGANNEPKDAFSAILERYN